MRPIVLANGKCHLDMYVIVIMTYPSYKLQINDKNLLSDLQYTPNAYCCMFTFHHVALVGVTTSDPTMQS